MSACHCRVCVGDHAGYGPCTKESAPLVSIYTSLENGTVFLRVRGPYYGGPNPTLEDAQRSQADARLISQILATAFVETEDGEPLQRRETGKDIALLLRSRVFLRSSIERIGLTATDYESDSKALARECKEILDSDEKAVPFVTGSTANAAAANDYCNRYLDDAPGVRGECARHLAKGKDCVDCIHRNIRAEVKDLRARLAGVERITRD
jgi:hypothetical protein